MKSILIFICCLLTANLTYSQNINIHGKVTTTNNKPIPFANVNLKDSHIGTATDMDGLFELDLPEGAHTLTVTSIGYESSSQTLTLTPSFSREIIFQLSESNESLNEVEVFGNRYDRPDKIEALTRLPLAPYNQIQSISIVSEKLIEQQGNLTISDATRNVPGVYTFATYGNRRESMSSRGFRGIPILKNGVRVNSDFRGVGIITDMQGVDNIQVLKGTAAITQGVATDLGSPGGVINLVTKTPRYEFGGNVTLRGGSYNQFRPGFDIYGPLNDQKNIAFRVNGAYSTADSYRALVSSERFYINPSFQWMIDDKSTLTLEMDYMDDTRTPDIGTVNMGEISENAIYDMPHDIFLGFRDDYYTTRNATYSVRFDRELTDRLSVKAAFYHSNLRLDEEGASLGRVVSMDGSPMYNLRTRGYSASDRRDNNSVFQLDLVGDELRTGDITHTFQVGADYRTNSYSTSTQTIGTLDQINIFEPINNTRPANLAFDPAQIAAAESRSFGLVAQDVITFNSWLKTFLGVRYSYTETTTDTEQNNDNAVNPLFGVILSPYKNVNVFGSYTNSSYPRTSARLDVNGNELGTERFDQLEVGVKTNWFDSRLRFNLTLFKINNRDINLPVYDENWVETGFYEKGGNDERKGIEVELTGRVLPNLEVITGYSYIDAKYKDHTSFVYNSAPLNTPKHTFNAYLNYTVTHGTFERLSLGGGVYYTGKRPINDWSSGAITHEGIVPGVKPFDVDAYTMVNLQASYPINPNWTLRVFANNIFDEIGYNAYRTRFINQTDPRNFAAAIQYHF